MTKQEIKRESTQLLVEMQKLIDRQHEIISEISSLAEHCPIVSGHRHTFNKNTMICSTCGISYFLWNDIVMKRVIRESRA